MRTVNIMRGMHFHQVFLFSCKVMFTWLPLIQGTADHHQIGCEIKINDIIIQKSIGEIWNSNNDLCLKHTCELDSNGTAIEKTFREYCLHTCHNEYQLVPRKNQCCGECVATKCSFDNRLYGIGEMWKSDDNCTFFECSKARIGSERDFVISAKINKYSKTCAPLGDCPKNRIIIKDCCQICRPLEPPPKSGHKNDTSDFVHPIDRNTEMFSRDTYLKHPCRRSCRKDEPPMICEYTFMVEWYETLSKACYECPFNHTDCYRPHCIYGDGFRRSVLVVNRMMPGPALEVCLGDTIVVDVENHLMGESTTIHWHGLHQTDTPYFDGVPQITQCAIPSHTSFQYRMKAGNAGTHWWHSHVGMQRADGSFGALIIRKPKNVEAEKLYDYDLVEHVMIMQDWDHRTGVSGFNSFHHSIGHNKPANILINAKGRYFEPPVHNQTQAIATNGNRTTKLIAIKETTLPPSQSQSFNSVQRIRTDNHKTDGSTATRYSQKPLIHTPSSESLSEEVPLHTFESLRVPISEDELPNILQSNKRSIRSSADHMDGVIESQFTPFEIFHVKAGSKYRFRTINSGFLNCPLEISIDNHTMKVIATDGHDFEPVVIDTFVSYAGERYDFILNADQPINNYFIRVKGLMDCDERFTKAHQGAILRYHGAPENDPEGELAYDFKRSGMQLNSLNRGTGHVDSVSVAELTSNEPDTPALLQENTDFKFYIYYDFYDKNFPQFNHPTLYNMSDVAKPSEQFFGPQLNHISMKMTPEPLLIARERNDETKFCNASSLAQRNINCRSEFCECTHVIHVPLNASVELMLIDEGYKYDANHPFHLHGHDFRVVAMERLRPSGITVEEIQRLDEAGLIQRRLKGAPLKDTVTVPDGGYTIIRFVANNPGFWLFHCHIEFHVEVGMAIVFKVGDYNQMRPLPKNFPTCYNFKADMASDDDEQSMNRPSDSTSIHWKNYLNTAPIVISLIMLNFKKITLWCD